MAGKKPIKAALAQGLLVMDLAAPDLPQWRFHGQTMSWPAAQGGDTPFAPSEALLLWVYEHLGDVLRELHGRVQAAEGDASPRHLETLALVAIRLGLRPEEAHSQVRVLEALDELKAEAAQARGVASALRGGLPDGVGLDELQDRADRAARSLCDGLDDYDDGHDHALVASSVVEQIDGRAAVAVCSRDSGDVALIAHGWRESGPDEERLTATRRADAVVAAGPLLFALTRVIDVFRRKGRP